MWLCSKQPSFFSFYALPSGGKLKGAVVHLILTKGKSNGNVKKIQDHWDFNLWDQFKLEFI